MRQSACLWTVIDEVVVSFCRPVRGGSTNHNWLFGLVGAGRRLSASSADAAWKRTCARWRGRVARCAWRYGVQVRNGGRVSVGWRRCFGVWNRWRQWRNQLLEPRRPRRGRSGARRTGSREEGGGRSVPLRRVKSVNRDGFGHLSARFFRGEPPICICELFVATNFRQRIRNKKLRRYNTIRDWSRAKIVNKDSILFNNIIFAVYFMIFK
jgi:hypothetical protein